MKTVQLDTRTLYQGVLFERVTRELHVFVESAFGSEVSHRMTGHEMGLALANVVKVARANDIVDYITDVVVHYKADHFRGR